MIDKYFLIGWEVKVNMLVINSFDGAIHPSTNTKDSGIVSYSTLLFHPDYFMKRCQPDYRYVYFNMNELVNRRKQENIIPFTYTNM